MSSANSFIYVITVVSIPMGGPLNFSRFTLIRIYSNIGVLGLPPLINMSSGEHPVLECIKWLYTNVVLSMFPRCPWISCPSISRKCSVRVLWNFSMVLLDFMCPGVEKWCFTWSSWNSKWICSLSNSDPLSETAFFGHLYLAVTLLRALEISLPIFYFSHMAPAILENLSMKVRWFRHPHMKMSISINFHGLPEAGVIIYFASFLLWSHFILEQISQLIRISLLSPAYSANMSSSVFLIPSPQWFLNAQGVSLAISFHLAGSSIVSAFLGSHYHGSLGTNLPYFVPYFELSYQSRFI